MKTIGDAKLREQLNELLKSKLAADEQQPLLATGSVEETSVAPSHAINLDDSCNSENEPIQRNSRLTTVYQNLIYRLTRDDIIQRALLYPFMRESNLQKHSESPSRLRHYWPIHTSARLNNPEIPLLLNKAVTGARLITDKAWPLTLLGLLSYDLHRYRTQPAQRYGNTLGGLMFGGLLPDSNLNLTTLSRHLGGGIIHEGKWYWLGISLAMMTPLLTALAYSLAHSHRLNVPQIIKLQATIDYLTKLEPSCYSNNLTGLWPFSGTAYHLLAAEHALLWRNGLDIETQNNLLEGIQVLAQRHSGLIQLAAIRSLAQLTQAMDKNLPQANGTLLSPLDMLQTMVKNKDARLLARYYAHYQLWTLGKSNKPWLHVLLLPPTLAWSAYVLYAKLRLGETLLQKMVTAIQTLRDARACRSSEQAWSYQPERADYVCGVCPDWQWVPQSQMNSSQGCIDGLLATEQNSRDLLSHMNRVLKPPFFTTLDLSRQPWTNWPVQDWQTLLTQIANSSLPELQLIRLSRPVRQPPQHDKLRFFNQFLWQTPVRHLELSGLGLGPRQLSVLLQGLPPTIKRLNLADNLLGDEGAAVLSQYLPKLGLESIDLSRNNLGDDGIADLAKVITRIGLKKLDLSANQFGAMGLSYLTECMPNTTLNKLDLSYNDLSLADLLEWGNAVVNSNLTHLSLRQTRLDPEQLEVLTARLASSSLQKLDLAYNSLSDEGLKLLLMGSYGSNLTEVDLSYSDIRDTGAAQLEAYLANTPWKALNLSGNQLGRDGLLSLARGMEASKVEHLALANMKLKDAAVLALAEVLHATNHALNSLNLADNQLSSEAAVVLLANLPANLTRLELQNNRLDDVFASRLAASLSQLTSLTYLDLSHNKIGPQGAELLSKRLGDAISLTQLRLAQNPLGATGGRSLASGLISQGPFSTELGDHSLSQDARRAIARARPQTALTELDLSGCELDDSAALALCPVQPYTHIPFAALDLTKNPLQSMDASNCRPRSHWQTAGFFQPASSMQRLTRSQTRLNPSDWSFGFILASLSSLGGLAILIYLSHRVINGYRARSQHSESLIPQTEQRAFQRSGYLH